MTFIYILESIVRSQDEGVAIINGKQVTIKIVEVKDVEENNVKPH